MSGRECDDALTNLYQYLDREIETTSIETIRGHLEGCSGCMQRFDFEARLKIVVRERLSEEVPPELIDRLRQALARESSIG
jgi:anti-sigma factor (TIGR02949 family)